MEFNIVNNKLLEVLNLVFKIANKKNILNNNLSNNIYIEVKNNTITLNAINLMGISSKIEADVFKEGKVLVPSKILQTILANTPKNTDLHILLEGTILKIKTPTSEVGIETLPTEDFPSMPVFTTTKKFDVQSEYISHGLKNVYYIASPIVYNQVLASVYIYTHNSDIRFVAADPFRFSEKTISNTKIKEDIKTLIPIENVSDIISILDLLKGIIEISFDDTYIIFKNENTIFFSRTVEGQFPNYRDILPKNNISEVIVDKNDFSLFLKKANNFSDDSNEMKISINTKENTITLDLEKKGVGNIKETISGKTKGENISLFFNHQYIQDALLSITTDSVRLVFVKGQSYMLAVKNTVDESFMCVIASLAK